MHPWCSLTFVLSRCVGLFAGVELVTDREKRTPATNLAALVVKRWSMMVQVIGVWFCCCEFRSTPWFIYNRLKEEDRICMSTDGPWDNILKLKPPMCFSVEDADLVVACLERILSGESRSTIRTANDEHARLWQRLIVYRHQSKPPHAGKWRHLRLVQPVKNF